MKKKAMISQPMGGLTEEEILEVKKDATDFLEANGYEVVDTYFEDVDMTDVKNEGIKYLGLSIDALSKVDALYCCHGWKEARGCVFEHDIAMEYGIEVITDSDDE